MVRQQKYCSDVRFGIVSRKKSKQTFHLLPFGIKLNFETVIEKTENVIQPPKDICCIYGVAFRPHTLGIFTLSLFSMLTAVPGVASSILVRLTFVEVDHEIYLVILLLQLIQEGLLLVTCERMCMKDWLTAWSSLPRK